MQCPSSQFQSADMQQWQNTSSVVLARVDANGSLTCAGFGAAVVSKGTNCTATTADRTIIVTAAVTITLPAASGNAGREYTVKNTSSGTVTVQSSSGNIDGSATYPLGATNKYVTLVSDGSNWYVVANN